MDIFHKNCKEAKTHMNVGEFQACVSQLEKAAQEAQKQWALDKPEVKKFAMGVRETSLTVVQLQESRAVPADRPSPLHETQALPLVEPVSWKKNLRGLSDDTVRLAKEATRLLDKANVFIVEQREKDVLARNKMVATLSKKINRTEDQITNLQIAISQAQSDMQADSKEMVNVEMRQAAVDDFLSVALARLEKRVERPVEEQARDPAHYALETEIRQARAEMAKLNTDHVRLSRSIIDLTKLKKRLELEVADKEEAVSLDNECVTRLSVHLVKVQ
jgi:soluble cytochrome b562